MKLTGNVDLTNTGIIGIGKDNEKGKGAQLFKGTLDGGNYTITLDIGTAYGNKYFWKMILQPDSSMQSEATSEIRITVWH